MNTYAVRRTNPLSKWAWRVVRTSAQTQDNGYVRVRTHKLLRKFETFEQAQAFLTRYTEAGLIDRLA
jgi:hypothetical protein